MSYFYLGTYWPADRPLTLRQYADATRNFLKLLHGIHPLFRSLEWVGDRPNSAVSLSPDLSNLDDVIYRHAASEIIYQDPNPDGSPSWKSVGKLGYGMVYGTGKSAAAGGLSITIDAGCYAGPTPNAVWISFPLPKGEDCLHREFYDYDFLKKLFSKMIDFWSPANGLVTSHPFSDAVSGDELPYVGWLTYLQAPRAAALRNDSTLSGLIFEGLPYGGTLISLGTNIISPDDFGQVEKARRLRDKLVAEKLV